MSLAEKMTKNCGGHCPKYVEVFKFSCVQYEQHCYQVLIYLPNTNHYQSDQQQHRGHHHDLVFLHQGTVTKPILKPARRHEEPAGHQAFDKSRWVWFENGVDLRTTIRFLKLSHYVVLHDVYYETYPSKACVSSDVQCKRNHTV